MAVLEIAILSATVIVLGSLKLADAINKREMEDNGEPKPLKSSDVYPFQRIIIGLPCVKCGAESKSGVPDSTGSRWKVRPAGPSAPVKCPDPISCRAKQEHFHVTCDTCGLTWFMSTKS
jgi:hypothetical protein